MRPQKEILNLRTEREFSEVFETGFALIRDNPKRFFRSLYTIAGPFLVASYAISYFIFSDSLDEFSTPRDISRSILTVALRNLLTFVAITGVTANYVALYVERNGGDFTVRDVWRRFRPQILGYVLLVALFWGLGAVGILFLFMGMPVMLTFMALMPIIYAQERDTAGSAFVRSFSLVSVDFWSTLGLVVFLGIVMTLWSYYLTGLLQSVINLITSTFLDTLSRNQKMFIGVSISVVLGVFLSISSAVCTAIFSVQYFSLLERKEFYSLKAKIDKIGEHLAQLRNKEEMGAESPVKQKSKIIY